MLFSDYLEEEMKKDPKLRAYIERERKRLSKKAKRHRSYHSLMGPVGSEKHYCFECQKLVKNPDAKEEQAALRKIATKKRHA